jgi:gamma-glutamyltranspeptidase/glutathione hydrolase
MARMHRWLPIALLGLACASPAPSTARTAPQPPAVVQNAAPPAPSPTPAPEPGAAVPEPSVEAVLAREIAQGERGAVSTAERYASRVGLEVLQKDGHAVDAAIAVALALAVTHPSAGNLGGGGFMIVRPAKGDSVAIDFREVAPRAATEKMYLDAQGAVTRDSVLGPLAAGVPGTVAGLELAHKRFGRLAWKDLVEPAARLARAGHVLDASHAATMAEAAAEMRAEGFTDSAQVYEGEDGKPLAEGAVWRQPDLAQTLQALAEHGPRAFYEGELAARIAAGVATLNGIWTAEDLRGYRAIERKPLELDYRGHRVITMPPPSAGGIVMRQLLAASEQLGIYKLPYRSAQAFHLYVEAARRAYADRNYWVGDPDFAPVPVAELTSTKYIRARMKDIDRKRATPSSKIATGKPISESPDTTHFSVVDGEGNAVAVTYTLNGSFGAKVVVPGTGILLNNEMDDFAAKPGEPNAYGLVQGARNAIAPGKRMLSSMTPTIVTKNGELRAVLGSPGGPTITNTVTEILMALVDHKQPLEQAVRAPRVHHQWLPDTVVAEASLEPELEAGLRERGHEVVKRASIGHASCIERLPKSRVLRAVADATRGGGSAEAY